LILSCGKKDMTLISGYIDRYDIKYVFATNGHRYGEYGMFSGLQPGLFPFSDFPPHPDLTVCYSAAAKDSC